MNPHAIVFDGPGALCRSFYAAPHAEGQVVANLVARMLKMQENAQAPEALVAWDSDRLERKARFAEYKAGRGPKPSAYKALVPTFFTACEGAGLRVLVCEGWEADDVLASVANRCYPLACVLVSDDKDVLQMLSIPRVTVIRPCDDYGQWDEFRFFREWGILPERLPDYLALVGDKVDGIPGIAGIGKESATWLLARFPSLTHIYDTLAEEDADDLPEHDRTVPVALANKLRGKQVEALRWRALTSLNRDLTIPSRYHGMKEVLR